MYPRGIHQGPIERAKLREEHPPLRVNVKLDQLQLIEKINGSYDFGDSLLLRPRQAVCLTCGKKPVVERQRVACAVDRYPLQEKCRKGSAPLFFILCSADLHYTCHLVLVCVNTGDLAREESTISRLALYTPRMVPEVIADLAEILVINKPAGLIAHSDGRTVEPSLADWIAATYPELRGVGGVWVSPQGESIQLNGVVHRLDRTTSGVMLVAKTDAAFTRLKIAFKNREIEKKYHAIVYGHVAEDSGVIVAEIERTKDTPRRWAARPTTPDDPRAAITEWRVLKRFETEGEPVTYLELTPKTGRTHQIRVHLASIGHPIVSDHLYAKDHKPLLNLSRPALHAHEIRLVVDGVAASFSASLPDDFSI